jgi:outer membrane protein assembly factor BamB
MKIPLLGWLLLAAVSGRAEDWLRFRGPNGAGVSGSTGLPVDFGPAKNLVWKTPLPFGRSSPIVAGDRVFVTARDGEKLLTLAIDRSSGKVLWRREIVRDRAHQIYRLNDPASPSPASDGVNVYVFFPDLGLVSYGPDGNERWRRPLGPFHNFYGMASSPVVSGRSVFLICDQQTNSFLIAVDKESGRVRWRVERPEMNVSYSTPIIYEPRQGEAQLVLTGLDRVEGVSVETGERRWWVGRTGGSIYSGPLLDRDRLFFVGEGSDTPMLPLFPEALHRYDTNKDGVISKEEAAALGPWTEHFGFMDADGDGRLDEREWTAMATYGLKDFGLQAVRVGGSGDITATATLWRFKKNLPQVPAPLLYQDVLYMVKSGGIVTSLDPATGKVFKEGRAGEALGAYYSSPVAADRKVFLVNGDGKVAVLRAGEQWEVLAVNNLEEETYATPAIADGRIYVRTHGHLYCFGAASRP